MFLFHTGSIKSRQIASNGASASQFLFHTGSIKSTDGGNTVYTIDKVSIPYWFD